MNDRHEGQRLPQSDDRLQARITVAAFLMGLGIALWALPVICLAFDMPRGVFGISTNLVSSASILVFGLGIFYGYQKQTNDWLGRSESEASNERQELRADVTELRESVAELRDLMVALSAGLNEHIKRVGLKVTQNEWNVYSDGVTDGMGQVADETDTRRLPEAKVYQMPQHLNRTNQGPQPVREVDTNAASHRRP